VVVLHGLTKANGLRWPAMNYQYICQQLLHIDKSNAVKLVKTQGTLSGEDNEPYLHTFVMICSVDEAQPVFDDDVKVLEFFASSIIAVLLIVCCLRFELWRSQPMSQHYCI
jgi:hypothetical protein